MTIMAKAVNRHHELGAGVVGHASFAELRRVYFLVVLVGVGDSIIVITHSELFLEIPRNTHIYGKSCEPAAESMSVL